MYNINQCALYKMQSKAQLADILNIGVRAMLDLSKSRKFRQFELPEKICEYTGKRTKSRQVQAPAEALCYLHDRIFSLLKLVDPPEYAHAAVKGRSYRTNAEKHKRSIEAATYDIKNFYRSTSNNSVFRFFLKQLFCSPDVSKILSNIVCFPFEKNKGCLPTGSSLSPLISIYANRNMFDALSRLAIEHELTFTCYVDDLAFSGTKIPPGFSNRVNSIVKRGGHTIASHKTKFFSEDRAKHITGVVIYEGSVTAPYSRHHKARKLASSIEKTNDIDLKINLLQKRAGLLGETAYLDKRFEFMAALSYAELHSAKIIKKLTI